MPMSASALGGEVIVDVPASDDALQSVELGQPAADNSGKEKELEADDAGDKGADRGGDSDEDEGYSPEKAKEKIQAARRSERLHKTRASRLEKQMVHLAVEVDGLKSLAQRGIEMGAKERQIEAQKKYNDAFARRTKAFDDGKSDDWNKADADLKAAERDFAVAGTQLAQSARAEPAGQTAVLKEWLDRPENSWFDPDGSDADSKTAIQVSREVARDGFANNTQAHFDELDARLRKKLPKLFAGDGGGKEGGDGEDDVEQTPRQQDRGPRGVQSGGRSQGAGVTDWGKNTKVPRGLIANYAAAGMDVNDPKIKARMIARYNETMSQRMGGVNVG